MTDETSGAVSEPDGEGRTAGERAAAVRSWLRSTDRSPRLVSTIRRVRGMLPGDPGFGDPLSTAGPGSARAVARVADRLLQDQPVASREVGLAALQVWQAAREKAGHGRGEVDMTLVFTDLVSFSSWALTAGDEATLTLLRRVASAVEPEIHARHGRVVKRMGDGLMAAFRRPDAAVDAMRAAQSNLQGIEVAGYRPVMRVGIHTGRPRAIGADWIGVDVNIAARLMDAGGDGNMMISAPALEHLDDDWLSARGLKVKQYRRFFSSGMPGVPDDLRMYVLKKA